jgi:hypothetical protein
VKSPFLLNSYPYSISHNITSWIAIPICVQDILNSHHQRNRFWLVVSTPLNNMTSSVGMMTFPIYMEKYFKCSKPPTRLWFIGDYIHTYNQVYKPPTRFYHRLNQLLHRRFPSTRWLPHRWLPPAAQAARQRVAARLRAGAAPPGRCGAFVGAQPGEAGKIPAVGPKNGGSTIENHGKTC